MPKHSRRYNTVAERIPEDAQYDPREAVELIKELSTAKFDETIEVHLRTNADVRHAEQQVRGVTVLPHGLGKQTRVLVFANGEAADIARQAGADYVGDDDLIAQVESGWVEFDVGLAIPEVMSKIGRLGRILGRRGLMPNPRTGTLVQARDLPRVIQESKAGRLEFRTDRTAIIHGQFGKSSFETDALIDNLSVFMDSVMQERPEAVKGTFIKSAYITSSMGPGISVDIAALQAMKPE
jgi:large subunit ribosomal protein L1